jgi:RNA polymerase sigma-70 factor, ECF subfamily
MPPSHPKPKKKTPDKDFQLIKAINAGQHQLFYDLVKRYESKLYNFGMRMCQDVRDAEDVVQDTFLNVFRYLKEFRYETKFKNWLYRIATTSCIKKRRKSKFAPEKELSLEEFLPAGDTPLPDEMPTWAHLPLERLLNEELSATIRSAIQALPEKYRLVMVLRDIEGFSTAETAQILNLKPSNIKVRLHRARLFLREQLKDYFDHDD